MKKRYLLLLAAGMCLATCKKASITTLPPITQKGANTFGCKVNGKIWVPHYRCKEFGGGLFELLYYIDPVDSSISQLPINFLLVADNDADGGTNFHFQQDYTRGAHIRDTGNVIDSVIIHFVGNISNPTTPDFDYTNANQYPGSPSPRYLQITKLDTVNKIISGIFAFTLYAGGSGSNIDSVVITEGRFDLTISNFATCSQ